MQRALLRPLIFCAGIGLAQAELTFTFTPDGTGGTNLTFGGTGVTAGALAYSEPAADAVILFNEQGPGQDAFWIKFYPGTHTHLEEFTLDQPSFNFANLSIVTSPSKVTGPNPFWVQLADDAIGSTLLFADTVVVPAPTPSTINYTAAELPFSALNHGTWSWTSTVDSDQLFLTVIPEPVSSIVLAGPLLGFALGHRRRA